jgi:hypothetical protein
MVLNVANKAHCVTLCPYIPHTFDDNTYASGISFDVSRGLQISTAVPLVFVFLF